MIAQRIELALERSAWIRRMFEEGDRMRAALGSDRVADLSLGNPIREPPPAARERLAELARETAVAGAHRYTQNAGLPSTRAAIASHLARHTGLPYRSSHVVMAVGAGGGLNVVLHALLDPGDEVIAFAPYFVDYAAYVATQGARLVAVPTDARFRPDLDRLADAIGPRTRAVLINSPNNPTGVTYEREVIEQLAAVLAAASRDRPTPIALISDEPYRAIVYDDTEVPWPPAIYPHTILVTSFSKDLSLAGERIGYVAVTPECDSAREVVDGMILATRVLGFVHAPVLMQRWVEALLDVRVDYSRYAQNRAALVSALERAGYVFERPTGAFYVFPAVPREDRDDLGFAQECSKRGLLVAPGSAFGAPGFFRLSYAVADADLSLGATLLADLAR